MIKFEIKIRLRRGKPQVKCDEVKWVPSVGALEKAPTDKLNRLLEIFGAELPPKRKNSKGIVIKGYSNFEDIEDIFRFMTYDEPYVSTWKDEKYVIYKLAPWATGVIIHKSGKPVAWEVNVKIKEG